MTRKIVYTGATLLVFSAIIFLSLTSGPVGTSLSNLDKIQHVLAYGALSLFAALSLSEWGVAKWRYILVLLFCAIVGGSLEILQSRFGRMMELGDFCADMIGACFGCLAVRFLFRSDRLPSGRHNL